MDRFYDSQLMWYIRLILFGLAAGFYLLKNVFRYSPGYINVLNDLLAIPVLLMVMENCMRMIYGHRFKIHPVHILVTVITISVLFEGIFPHFSKTATADALDVLWYTVGGILYYMCTIAKGIVPGRHRVVKSPR